MKTTLDLPATLLHDAETMAIRAGISVEQLLADLLREKLNGTPKGADFPTADTSSNGLESSETTVSPPHEPRWRKCFGIGEAYADELKRIDAIIEEEFEQIDPEDWK